MFLILSNVSNVSNVFKVRIMPDPSVKNKTPQFKSIKLRQNNC